MYEKWTQTKESEPSLMNERTVFTGPAEKTPEIQNEVTSHRNKSGLRDTSSRLKKK